MPNATSRVLTGWGRIAASRARVITAPTGVAVDRALTDAGHRGIVARGLGRSYGDAAQNANGDVIDATAIDIPFDFDASTGLLRVGGGVSLDTIMRQVVPQGWFVPVTPGTRFVTIGGAFAADIHGKNHHCDGSFANHVNEITLHTPTGTHTITPTSEPELFWETAGAMGLTGVITSATVQLLPIETSRLQVDTERTVDLDDLLDRMTEGDHRYRYSVAWVDCLAKGRALGRSVLTRGNHAPYDALAAPDRSDPLAFAPRTLASAPPWVPRGLLNRFTVRAFNEVWYRKAPRHHIAGLESIGAFFHPLDGVNNWNRLYGRPGFLQYQYVVPDSATATVRATLEQLAKRQCASFLAVLKRFGPENPGALSFPMPGWTLAIDLPATTNDLGVLLGDLDRLVVEAGGRTYLAKDSHLSPTTLRAMYPNLKNLEKIRDRVDPKRVLQSDLSRRLEL